MPYAIIFIAALVAGIIFCFNRLIVLRNRCRNSRFQVDSELKRRHDLLPRLVDAVRAYQDYEQDVLKRATDMRTEALQAGDAAARDRAELRLDGVVKDLFVLIENYPQLKASQSVLALQASLSETEDRIRFARQFLNDTVMKYNNLRQSFPAVLIAQLFGFDAEPYVKRPDVVNADE
ncbi:LemA family protein [candidate division KSB1 bacterium]|nr:MAG: LemA family protein [candidate division KSB1 bacterium]